MAARLQQAQVWVHFQSQKKSCIRFDKGKKKVLLILCVCVCVHHLQTTVTFKGQNSDMINEMQESEKSESLFSV